MSKFSLDENNLSFTVVSVDKIAKQYAGAEGEFKKGEVLTYDELIDAIKGGSETINGWCEVNFDNWENKIFLAFIGMNPNSEEDGQDYIDDTYVTLTVGLNVIDEKLFADLTEVIEEDGRV